MEKAVVRRVALHLPLVEVVVMFVMAVVTLIKVREGVVAELAGPALIARQIAQIIIVAAQVVQVLHPTYKMALFARMVLAEKAPMKAVLLLLTHLIFCPHHLKNQVRTVLPTQATVVAAVPRIVVVPMLQLEEMAGPGLSY